MNNYTPGEYRVLQYPSSVEPVIARLTKNSDWKYPDGSECKMSRNGPFKVIEKIERACIITNCLGEMLE